MPGHPLFLAAPLYRASTSILHVNKVAAAAKTKEMRRGKICGDGTKTTGISKEENRTLDCCGARRVFQTIAMQCVFLGDI
jgi:hypothetical protein